MVTSDRIRIEMFQFPKNEGRNNKFEYAKTGLFHFSVQDPDLEGLVKKIVETSGKQRMPTGYVRN